MENAPSKYPTGSELRVVRDGTPHSIVSCALIGAVTTFLSIGVSSLVVGPLLRLFLGAPEGFRTDVTSPEEYSHGTLSNGICLAFGFAAVGFLGFGANWPCRFIISNPIGLALGCIAFSNLAPLVAMWDYGFVGFNACWRVVLSGVPLGILAVTSGNKLARHRSKRAVP